MRTRVVQISKIFADGIYANPPLWATLITMWYTKTSQQSDLRVIIHFRWLERLTDKWKIHL